MAKEKPKLSDVKGAARDPREHLEKYADGLENVLVAYSPADRRQVLIAVEDLRKAIRKLPVL